MLQRYFYALMVLVVLLGLGLGGCDWRSQELPSDHVELTYRVEGDFDSSILEHYIRSHYGDCRIHNDYDIVTICISQWAGVGHLQAQLESFEDGPLMQTLNVAEVWPEERVQGAARLTNQRLTDAAGKAYRIMQQETICNDQMKGQPFFQKVDFYDQTVEVVWSESGYRLFQAAVEKLQQTSLFTDPIQIALLKDGQDLTHGPITLLEEGRSFKVTCEETHDLDTVHPFQSLCVPSYRFKPVCEAHVSGGRRWFDEFAADVDQADSTMFRLGERIVPVCRYPDLSDNDPKLFFEMGPPTGYYIFLAVLAVLGIVTLVKMAKDIRVGTPATSGHYVIDRPKGLRGWVPLHVRWMLPVSLVWVVMAMVCIRVAAERDGLVLAFIPLISIFVMFLLWAVWGVFDGARCRDAGKPWRWVWGLIPAIVLSPIGMIVYFVLYHRRLPKAKGWCSACQKRTASVERCPHCSTPFNDTSVTERPMVTRTPPPSPPIKKGVSREDLEMMKKFIVDKPAAKPSVDPDIEAIFNKQREILIQSEDPMARLRALRQLALMNLNNNELRNKVVDEYIETLKNDWRGELALAAALALATNVPQREYIRMKLQSCFRRFADRQSSTGRHLQVAACYPLLFMKDAEFFTNLSTDDFKPAVPSRLDDLLTAGRTSDLKQALDLVVYFEGMETMQEAELFKEVIKTFEFAFDEKGDEPDVLQESQVSEPETEQVKPDDGQDVVDGLMQSFKKCLNTELSNIFRNPDYSLEMKRVFLSLANEAAVDSLLGMVREKVELAVQDDKPHNRVIGLTQHPVLAHLDVRPGVNLDTLGEAWKQQVGRSYAESIQGLLINAKEQNMTYVLHLFFCFDDTQSGVAIAFLPQLEDVQRVGSLIPYSMHPSRG